MRENMNRLSTILIPSLCLVYQPALAEDLSLKGKAIFESHCIECHGEDAREGASGDIRDVDMQQIRMATSGVEDMPEIELEKAELEALLAYLHSLL